MSRHCLVLLAIIILATAAHAIDEPEDLGFGVLGVFTAPEVGDDVYDYHIDVSAGQPVDLYFTLYHHRLASTQMGGFEFTWEVLPGNLDYLVLDAELLVWDSFNFGDSNNLIVGVRLPTTYNFNPIPLVKVTIMFTEAPDGASIRLQPSWLESIAGEMAYAGYRLPDDLLIMRPNNANQSLDDPVFWFNPSVAVENHSLSSVKALFD